MNVESIQSLKLENSKLQKELDFTRALLESANSIVIRWGKDGIILYMNDFGLRFFGYSSAELIGQHLMTIVPKVEKSSGRDMSMLAKDIVKNPDQYRSVSSENITRDGRTVWVTWTNKGLFDECGNTQEILAIGNDITALKQAKMSLWETQEKLNAALESMNEAVYISDSQGNLVHFNNAFALFHRFKDKDECTSQLEEYAKVLDVFFADGTPASLDQWAIPRALRGESGSDFEYTCYRKDTGESWIGSYNYGPFFDRQGNIAGAVMVARDITEKKLAEELLSKQKYYLEKAQELGHLGTWDLDIVNNTLVWTDENYRIFGVPPGSIVSYEIFIDKVHPDDREYVGREWAAALQGKPYDIEHRIIIAGETRWVREKADITFNAKGTAVSAVGVTQDITERKQAEANLIQSRKLLTEMGKIGKIGGWEFNFGTGNHHWTEEIYHIHEVPLDCDPTLEEGINFYSEASQPLIAAAVQRAIEHGEPYDLELELITAKGNLRQVHTIGMADRENTRIYGIFQDITEKRQQEELVRVSNKDLRLAQRIAHIGNWTLDPEVGVPEWSDEIYRIYERDPELGPYAIADFKNVYKGKWLEKITSAIQRAAQEGQPYDIELKLELAPDHVKWVHSICEPERKSGSKGYFLRGTIQDITERKQLEKKLVAMDALKNEFISTAAHELRTPLSAIMGFTDLLLNPEVSSCFNEEQKKEYLGDIYSKGEALNRLVDDLLDISRIESGKPIPLDRQESNLGELLAKSLDFFRLAYRGRVFKLELPKEAEQRKLKIDFHRINQVIANLVSNAVKYSSEQTEISVAGKSNADGWTIRIKDQGIGMTSEQVDHIFDKFYRADSSNTAVGGLGLGMGIAKQIVEAHGGSLRVESIEGKGTTATFNLPYMD